MIDLGLVKKALFALWSVAAMLCGIFLISTVAIIWRDHDRPQFPYEVAIAISGAMYFGALSIHTWRGMKHALQEDRVAETVRRLSQSVLSMLVPIALITVLLIWLVFQPAY